MELEQRVAQVQAVMGPALDALRRAVAAAPVNEKPAWWDDLFVRVPQPSRFFPEVLFASLAHERGDFAARIEAVMASERRKMEGCVAAVGALLAGLEGSPAIGEYEAAAIEKEVLLFMDRSILADECLRPDVARHWTAFSLVSLSKWDHDFGQSAVERGERARLFPAMLQLLNDMQARVRFTAEQLAKVSSTVRGFTTSLNNHAKNLFYLKAALHRERSGVLPCREHKAKGEKRQREAEAVERAMRTQQRIAERAAERAVSADQKRAAAELARLCAKQDRINDKLVARQRSSLLSRQTAFLRIFRHRRIHHMLGETGRERLEVAMRDMAKVRLGRRRRDRKRGRKQKRLMDQIADVAAADIAQLRHQGEEALANLAKADASPEREARIYGLQRRVELMVASRREVLQLGLAAAAKIIEEENAATAATRLAMDAPVVRSDDNHLQLQLSAEARRLHVEASEMRALAARYKEDAAAQARRNEVREDFILKLVIERIGEAHETLRALRNEVCLSSLGVQTPARLVEYGQLHARIASAKECITVSTDEFHKRLCEIGGSLAREDAEREIAAWLCEGADEDIEEL